MSSRAESSTSAPVFRRVSLDEAFNSFSLNENDKTEVANYFKKYTVPSDYKKYPSWILFRATELVLNFLGHFSSRVESKGKKLEKTIQIHLNNLGMAQLGCGANAHQTTTQLPNGQMQIHSDTNKFKENLKVQRVIERRSKLVAHHLLSQFCSSAKRDSQANVTVRTSDIFTLETYRTELFGDNECLSVSSSLIFRPEYWLNWL